MNPLENQLRELCVSPIGSDPTKPPSNRQAICPRCVRYRFVVAGRFVVHNDDNGSWCNGSGLVVAA